MTRNLLKRNDRAVSLFEDFQHQVNALFKDFWHEDSSQLMQSEFNPKLDVSENDNQILVKIDLPGVEQNDIHVEIKDHMLSIKGERKQERNENQEKGYIREVSYGSFQRCLSLPAQVKEDQVTASYKNGVLHIELPKDESNAPKQITVNVS